MMGKREKNIAVFQDTRQMIQESPRLQEAVENTRKNQRFYPEEKHPSGDYFGHSHPKTIVSTKRTLEAAEAYRGKKVCVLNYASATNPGGGVVNGASAQEESLCRCSTLYFNLAVPEMMIDFYEPHRALKNPLYNDDVIYSPDVMVIKTDTDDPKRLAEADWYAVNVITCAAPNLKRKNGFLDYLSDHYEYTYLLCDRIRHIFTVAEQNGNEILILGAFGCGAFYNTPRLVADAFGRVMNEFRNSFELIEFAIYCSDAEKTNYNEFVKRFLEMDVIPD